MNRIFLRRYSRIVWMIVFGMSLLFFDFLSKAYVYHVLSFSEVSMGIRRLNIPIFFNFLGIDFSITLAVNRGAAWGFFSDFQTVLIGIRIIAIFGMFLYLFCFNRKRGIELPLILIIAGALGNVVDFFLYGYVIDFLHFILWGYDFPIFNFADSCITIGVVWLFLIAILKKKKNCVNV